MPFALPALVLAAAALAYQAHRQRVPRVEAPELSDTAMERLSPGLQAFVRQARVVRASLDGAVTVIDTPDVRVRGYRDGGDETQTNAYRSHLVAADANALLGDLADQAAGLSAADRDVLTRAGFSLARFVSLIDMKVDAPGLRGQESRASRVPIARALWHLDALEPALERLGSGDPYRQ